MTNKRIGDMSRDELMDYIIELDEENGRYERKLDKLQSNWNSLREWLKYGIEEYTTDDGFIQHILKQGLDKMNELEGKDKE